MFVSIYTDRYMCTCSRDVKIKAHYQVVFNPTVNLLNKKESERNVGVDGCYNLSPNLTDLYRNCESFTKG